MHLPRRPQALHCILAVAIGCLWFPLTSLATEKEAIVWECGQNAPSSAYWRKYQVELEAMLPFDGVMLGIRHPVVEDGLMGMKGHVASEIFNKAALTNEMVAASVENMQATKLETLKHNLVYVGLRSRDQMNYFDDGWWTTINANIGIVAQAAKDMGCVGLLVDSDQYRGAGCFDHPSLAAQKDLNKPYKEYVGKVRQRGKAFGEALSKALPDCKLLFRHGHSLSVSRLKQAMLDGTGDTLDSLGDLYPAFLDGMLEGTNEGTVFIDGMAQAYGYTTAKEFRHGRWLALLEPLTITAVPALFRQKVRCGFGLWTDHSNDAYSWHPFEPERNLYSPGRLQRTIHLALKYSDGYVWLWNEKANWYVDGGRGQPHPPFQQMTKAYGVSQDYRDAVREAKHWPGLDTTRATSDELADTETLGFIDGEELDQLLSETRKLMDLPNEDWYFRPDRYRVGVKERWYVRDVPIEQWEPDFVIGQFWESPKNHKYADIDGVAWYRREVKFDDIPDDALLYLHFGAVDDSMHLWIDGKYVGTYSRGPNVGWDNPFAIEVTDRISNGKHTLVIRGQDAFAMGGVWKGVELIAEHSE